MEPSDDEYRTESQRQWRDWSESGYNKMYQPTSMLWLGGIFFLVLIVGLVAVFYFASHGGL